MRIFRQTSRMQMLSSGAFFCIAMLNCVLSAAEVKQPNIILVLVDDLGWMDIGCQGNERVDTPNIDRFASSGVRFTDAYSAAPVCSPTRAALMTGKTPARLQITNHIPDRPQFTPEKSRLEPGVSKDFLTDKEQTIAELLDEAGYATGFFGKWHLCGRSKRGGLGELDYYPENQGFDLNVAGCAYGGPPSYFSPYKIHNLKDGPKGEYLTHRLVDEAARFMRSNRKKPFFVALWHYTVHWPMEAPKELVAKYEKRKGKGVKDPRYAAMTESLDIAFGQLLATVDELGVADNTLIIFTSDNGAYLGVAGIEPLRLGKGYLYEGGIRVPLIVGWKGKIESGRVDSTPVVSMDLFETMASAAKVKPASRQRDGVDLMPLLTKNKKLAERSLYFHYPNFAWHKSNRLGSVVRRGRHKLIHYYDKDEVELYDLKSDIGERNNLASQKPDLARSMLQDLNGWRKQVKAAEPTVRSAD